MKKTYNGRIRPTSLVALKNETNSVSVYVFLTFLFMYLPLAVVRHWENVLLPVGTVCLILTWFNPEQQFYATKIATLIVLHLALIAIAIFKDAHRCATK